MVGIREDSYNERLKDILNDENHYSNIINDKPGYEGNDYVIKGSEYTFSGWRDDKLMSSGDIITYDIDGDIYWEPFIERTIRERAIERCKKEGEIVELRQIYMSGIGRRYNPKGMPIYKDKGFTSEVPYYTLRIEIKIRK